MALHFYLNRAVNEKLRANGLTTATTFHRTRMTGAEVISAISAQSGLQTGHVQGVLQGYAELLAREIANGSVVEMPFVGTIREDVRGVIEPESPNTKGQTETKTHLRTSPQFKAQVKRYLTAVQVPKVIPAPEIQIIDTTFKYPFEAPDGTQWGPMALPSDQIFLMPASGVVVIKGKNLIWDVTKSDEGLFYAKYIASIRTETRIQDTLIHGRRGRSITLPAQALGAQVAPGGINELIIRSRLGSRDLRSTSYILRWTSTTGTPPVITLMQIPPVDQGEGVLVPPVGFSNMPLTLEMVELARHPAPQDATAGLSEPFPSEAESLHPQSPTTRRGHRTGREEQIARNIPHEVASSVLPHPPRSRPRTPSEQG